MGVRILGIDPGTLATGWGVIEAEGQAVTHCAHGVIRTRAADPLWTRLHVIQGGLAAVLVEHRPDVMSLERVFVNKNVQSALKLGHARGVAMVTCVAQALDVHEYTAGEIKRAVTGNGRADKHQVQEMVRIMLRLPSAAATDASDALAAALCHMQAAQFARIVAATDAGTARRRETSRR